MILVLPIPAGQLDGSTDRGTLAQAVRMADSTLGKLFVALVADDKDFNAGMDRAKKQVQSFGDSVSSIGDTVSAVFTGMVATVGAVTAGIAALSASVGTEFQKNMSQVGALANASDGDLQRLTDTARQLGASTAFSASEAAEAMTVLAQAGFNTEQIIAVTGKALDLAAASGGTLAQAAEITASAMSAFGLKAEESGRITDVFTATLNQSQLDMEGLTKAMQYAGPVGASFGMTIEETAAAVAQFSNLGLQGAKAGTAFRMSMSQAANVTREGRDVLAKYGLTAEKVNPEVNDFGEILMTIAQHGVTATDAMKVFGTEAGPLLVTLGQQAIAAADGVGASYDDMVASIEDSSGLAELTAAKMMDNVAGSFEETKGALEELLLTLFDQYKGPLQDILDGATTLINAVSDEFKARAAEFGEAFSESGQTVTQWMDANKGRISKTIVDFALALTQVAAALTTILDYLPDLAIGFATVFAAFKVAQFVSALETVITSLVTMQGGVAALMTEITVATGGLYALVAAIGVVVAGLVALIAYNVDAAEKTDLLTKAQGRQAQLNDENYQKELDRIQSLMSETQARARMELKSSGDLSASRRRELETMLDLDAQTALLKVRSGELIEVNGILSTTAYEVGKAYETADMSAFTETFGALTKEEKATKDEMERLQHAVDTFGATDWGQTAQGAAAMQGALKDSAGVENIDEAKIRLEALGKKLVEIGDKRAKIANDVAIAESRMTEEAERAAKGQGVLKIGIGDTAKEADAAAKAMATWSNQYEQSTSKLLAVNTAANESIAKSDNDARTAVDFKYSQMIVKAREAYAEVLNTIQVGEAQGLITSQQADAQKLSAMLSYREAFVNIETAHQAALQDIDDKAAKEKATKDAEAAKEREQQHKQSLDNLAQITRGNLNGVEQIEQAERDFLIQNDTLTADERIRVAKEFGKQKQSEIQRQENDLDSLRSTNAAKVRLIEAEAAQWMLEHQNLTSQERYEATKLWNRKIEGVQVDWFEQTVSTVGKVLGAFGTFATGLGSIFSGVAGIFTDALSWFSNLTGMTFNLMDAVQQVADVVQQSREDAAASGDPLAEGMTTGDAVNQVVTDMSSKAVDMIAIFAEAAPQLIQSLVGQLPTLFEALTTYIPQAIVAVASQIPTLIEGVVTQLPILVTGLIDAIGPLIDTLVNAVPGIIASVIASVGQIVDAIITSLPRIITSILDSVPVIIKSVVDSIPAIVINVMQAVPTIIKAILDEIPMIITSLIEGVIGMLPSIVVAAVKMVPQIIVVAVKAVPLIVMAVINEIPFIIETVIGLIPMIITALIEEIPTLIPAVIMLVPTLIIEIIKALPAIVVALVKSIVQELILKFPELAWGMIKAIVEAFWQAIKDFVHAIGEALKQAWQSIFGGGDDEKSGGQAYSGVEYVPATMRMTVHEGEAIVPAARNGRRSRGSAGGDPARAGQGSQGGGGGGSIEVPILVDGRLVDAVLVTADRDGNADGVRRMTSKGSGIRVGFDRGRYNRYNK